tara:strand:+ start:250 stop:381 length:132 start_codon:yes stop_codon:yes gene_type:complete
MVFRAQFFYSFFRYMNEDDLGLGIYQRLSVKPVVNCGFKEAHA